MSQCRRNDLNQGRPFARVPLPKVCLFLRRQGSGPSPVCIDAFDQHFGTMRPRLIARIIMSAVIPFETISLSRAGVSVGPPPICTRPTSRSEDVDPGINDTTEAKPIAANGMWRRCDSRRENCPPTKHATRAPVATPIPRTEIAAQRRAWASMPIASGHVSILKGIEKKDAEREYSDARSHHVLP